MNEKEYSRTHHNIFFKLSQGVKHESRNRQFALEGIGGGFCPVFGVGGGERLDAATNNCGKNGGLWK